MIDMHSKYDNMHKNEMFYALICINNNVIACYQQVDRSNLRKEKDKSIV